MVNGKDIISVEELQNIGKIEILKTYYSFIKTFRLGIFKQIKDRTGSGTRLELHIKHVSKIDKNVL